MLAMVVMLAEEPSGSVSRFNAGMTRESLSVCSGNGWRANKDKHNNRDNAMYSLIHQATRKSPDKLYWGVASACRL